MVSINGVSDVPRGINLGDSRVAENEPSGTTAGSLSVIDSHTAEAFTCSLEKDYFYYAGPLSLPK